MSVFVGVVVLVPSAHDGRAVLAEKISSKLTAPLCTLSLLFDVCAAAVRAADYFFMTARTLCHLRLNEGRDGSAMNLSVLKMKNHVMDQL